MVEGPRPSADPSDPSGLSGAVVVVTGASSGIGLATARELVRLGANPVMVARRAELLADHVAAMTTGPGGDDPSGAARGQALAVAEDLADPLAPGRIVAAALRRFGRLDAVVNNAAVVRHLPLEQWDVAEFDRHLAVNVRAPFLLIQQALAALRVSPVAAVVNVSSSSGTLRLKGQSVYGMTKAALDYLTGSLAGELAAAGVRVNTVAPGPIDTPIHATWADDLEVAYRWLAEQVPLGRIGRTDDVVAAIVYLLGRQASFVTGAVLPVDGGQVIRP